MPILGPVQRRSENKHGLINTYRNRTWLLDLANKVPPSTQLHGFDTTGIYYPHTSFLAPNMSLGLMDIMNGPPQELLEKYDIVHIRFFSSEVHGTNPKGMLDNCLKILSKRLHLLPKLVFDMCSSTEPGGYIQWDEFNTIESKIVSSQDHNMGSVNRLAQYTGNSDRYQ